MKFYFFVINLEKSIISGLEFREMRGFSRKMTKIARISGGEKTRHECEAKRGE